MTKIYMVRHCEALGNVQRIFQGTTDLDISEMGGKQLKELEKRFEKIQIDRIFSSPLIRTIKTANAVKGTKNISVEIEKGLIEINGGIVEGKPFKETFQSIPHLADAWDNHPEDFHPEGGEAMSHAYERIWNTVFNIAKSNQGKNIACVSHGGVIRCLNCRLKFGDIKELKNMTWSENTAVTLIEFDESLNPKVVFCNDVSHLPDEFLPKRNRLASFMKGN